MPENTKKLAGKVAVVTGASKGIGAEIAKPLAKELAPRQIRVNSINPGLVETEGLHSTGFIEHHWLHRTQPGAGRCHTAGSHRTTTGHRAWCGFSCLFRFRLDDRRNAVHCRRSALKGKRI